MCNFELAYAGICAVEAETCPLHSELKCCVCGKQATSECHETFGLVCGAPLCNDCEHEIAPNGTNGGTWNHCKKSDQKYQPWYAREPVDWVPAADGIVNVHTIDIHGKQ